MNPFEEIFEAAVEGVFVSNSTGKIILCNTSAANLFGYSVEEMLNISVEQLIPSPSSQNHTELRKAYFQEPSPRQMGHGRELFGQKKDGTRIPVEISLSHTQINNTPIAIAFVIDITERKRIENAIQKEKETAQMYLDIAGAIFMVLDTSGKVILINQAGSQVLGLEEKQIIGKDWFENFVPEDRKNKVRSIFRRIIEDAIEFRRFDEQVVNAKGDNRIVSWHVGLIKDANGVPNSLLGSGVDITDRITAEKALKRSQEKLIIYATELEKKVSERTSELAEAISNLEKTNKELFGEIQIRQRAETDARKALKKEKELSEMKSRFVSLASHEFRTPLSTILSSATLISKYDEAEKLEKRHKHIKRIKNNVANLTSLLNDFLNLERVEEGKVIANYEKFDFIELVNEVVEEMQAIAKPNQMIELHPDEKVGLVDLDKQMLKNIYLNLLSNAIKYSPPGSEIYFGYKQKKDKLIIEIKDKGMGIPQDEQYHLFSRFFRAKNAAGIQGSGLGLYLVKKYVEEMNGSITFVSELEKGTSFKIIFPIKL